MQEISDFEFMEERQEIPIYSEFNVLPIAVSNKHSFTNCTSVNTETNDFERLAVNPPSSNVNIYPKPTQDSNYNLISHFLSTNADLITKKLNILKIFDSEVDKIGYLKYSNFGICNLSQLRAHKEGLLSVRYYTKILKVRDTASENHIKIYSTKLAKVFVFTPISVISPMLTDEFTKAMLTKSASMGALMNNDLFIIAPETKIQIQLKGGIHQW